jgi:hypothetical protein
MQSNPTPTGGDKPHLVYSVYSVCSVCSVEKIWKICLVCSVCSDYFVQIVWVVLRVQSEEPRAKGGILPKRGLTEIG